MFLIDQHIEYLLLNHNCVIVPGFGGFVVHDVPASFDKSDGMMLPPSTTVGFNPQLTLNDSLLIQSFVEAYDMSYPEAQREVEHETEEMKGLIADNNSFEIHSVGKLSINADGNYEFEPCQAGVLIPRLYGLSGIDTNEDETFALLKKSKVPTSTQPVDLIYSDNNEEDTDNDEKVFSITAKTLKKVAAACIAIMFLVAIPFLAQNKQTQHMLSGIDLSFFTKLLPSDEVKNTESTAKKATPIAPAAKKTTQETKTETSQSVETKAGVKETTIETPTPNVEEQPTEKPTSPVYAVVLAAQVSQKNADIYVERLTKDGYKDVRVIGQGKGRKVVIGSYKSEEEARQYKRELSSTKEFASAWVFEIK